MEQRDQDLVRGVIRQEQEAFSILFQRGGRLAPVRHSWRQGLTPAEAFARVVGARQGLYAMLSQFSGLQEEHDARSRPAGYGVLSRARRAHRPGVVFARAARQGEVDPLTDEYARLFVGLPETGN